MFYITTKLLVDSTIAYIGRQVIAGDCTSLLVTCFEWQRALYIIYTI